MLLTSDLTLVIASWLWYRINGYNKSVTILTICVMQFFYTASGITFSVAHFLLAWKFKEIATNIPLKLKQKGTLTDEQT